MLKSLKNRDVKWKSQWDEENWKIQQLSAKLRLSKMKFSIFLIFLIFLIVHGDFSSENRRIGRQAYIWNARACDNGGTPPYCCLNGEIWIFLTVFWWIFEFWKGASNPDCCKKGSGKYCCFNGAENPDCVLEEDKSHRITG